MDDLILNYVSRETIPFFEKYIEQIKLWNRRTGLIQIDTIKEIWQRHILDSLQVATYIPNKEAEILDIGTGGGFPGIVLAIAGYTNLTLCESNIRKVVFLNEVKRSLDLKIKVINGRVENIPQKFQVVTSRACANLTVLLGFMENVSRETKSYGVFLKGKIIEAEIAEAQQAWSFEYEKHPSITAREGCILVIKNLRSKGKID